MEFSCSARQGYQILRKQKGISLRELASNIGVSTSILSMYENEVANLQKDKEKLYRELIFKSEYE
ncbi:helix-turn-helix protein [compost metagenome]